jgi:predicted nuclease of restriction endonuclease-like (RecB) superfamily
MGKKRHASDSVSIGAGDAPPGDSHPPAPTGYAQLLKDIKARIQQSRTRAIFSLNAEVIRLYWDIGRMIDERQHREGWGAAVIPRLARGLHNELPEEKGYSERNIKRMLAFYRAYRDPAAIVPQAVAQFAADQKVPPRVGPTSPPADSLLWLIPWGHHSVLMEKVGDLPTRRWYMEQTLANGWSRDVLSMAIGSDTYRRRGGAVTNFDQSLPAPQSDLAQQTLKDPYIFDFVTLDRPFHERELETNLIHHLEKFLLELGQGFAFVGRQYRIEVDGCDYYIDLLFYHLKLRAFVVVDLKTGAFRPEFAGKINFYCNVINDTLRHPADHPTIGLILCQSKERLLAEYALGGIDKPIGVSSYELTRALPANLRSALPTVEEIEAELDEPKADTKAASETAVKGRDSRTTKKPRRPSAKKRAKG